MGDGTRGDVILQTAAGADMQSPPGADAAAATTRLRVRGLHAHPTIAQLRGTDPTQARRALLQELAETARRQHPEMPFSAASKELLSWLPSLQSLDTPMRELAEEAALNCLRDEPAFKFWSTWMRPCPPSTAMNRFLAATPPGHREQQTRNLVERLSALPSADVARSAEALGWLAASPGTSAAFKLPDVSEPFNADFLKQLSSSTDAAGAGPALELWEHLKESSPSHQFWLQHAGGIQGLKGAPAGVLRGLVAMRATDEGGRSATLRELLCDWDELTPTVIHAMGRAAVTGSADDLASAVSMLAECELTPSDVAALSRLNAPSTVMETFHRIDAATTLDEDDGSPCSRSPAATLLKLADPLRLPTLALLTLAEDLRDAASTRHSLALEVSRLLFAPLAPSVALPEGPVTRLFSKVPPPGDEPYRLAIVREWHLLADTLVRRFGVDLVEARQAAESLAADMDDLSSLCYPEDTFNVAPVELIEGLWDKGLINESQYSAAAAWSKFDEQVPRPSPAATFWRLGIEEAPVQKHEIEQVVHDTMHALGNVGRRLPRDADEGAFPESDLEAMDRDANSNAQPLTLEAAALRHELFSMVEAIQPKPVATSGGPGAADLLAQARAAVHARQRAQPEI